MIDPENQWSVKTETNVPPGLTLEVGDRKTAGSVFRNGFGFTKEEPPPCSSISPVRFFFTSQVLFPAVKVMSYLRSLKG